MPSLAAIKSALVTVQSQCCDTSRNHIESCYFIIIFQCREIFFGHNFRVLLKGNLEIGLLREEGIQPRLFRQWVHTNSFKIIRDTTNRQGTNISLCARVDWGERYFCLKNDACSQKRLKLSI